MFPRSGNNKLFLSRCANRTSVSTRAAADAIISVDNVLTIALSNATYGTSVCACATSDALVGNLECHLTNLHICCLFYFTIYREKIKSIL